MVRSRRIKQYFLTFQNYSLRRQNVGTFKQFSINEKIGLNFIIFMRFIPFADF